MGSPCTLRAYERFELDLLRHEFLGAFPYWQDVMRISIRVEASVPSTLRYVKVYKYLPRALFSLISSCRHTCEINKLMLIFSARNPFEI